MGRPKKIKKARNPRMILRALFRCGYLPKPGEDISEEELIWGSQSVISVALE